MMRKPHKHQPTPEAFASALRYSEAREKEGIDETARALELAYHMLTHLIPKYAQDGNETLAYILMRLKMAQNVERN